MLLTRVELDAIRAHAEREYPAECCGVLLVRIGRGAERHLYPCRNIQDELHRKDPERFPRDSRTAYYMSHENLLEIGRRETRGYAVQVIYHSHVDAGAYFSETDRRNALLDGHPTYPDATYLVVAVHERGAAEARAFRWDEERHDFLEVPLETA